MKKRKTSGGFDDQLPIPSETDISNGLELAPVIFVNDIDESKPQDTFERVLNYQLTQNINSWT
jgi:hypothetical protein